MVKSEESKNFTGLDWFTVVTGIIGLVSNIITLASLFIGVQKAEAVHSEKATGISTAIWILIFFTIVYTTSIVSFYARRLFSKRHKRKRGNLSQRSYDQIEFGAGAVTVIFGGTFFLILAILGAMAGDMPVFAAVLYGGAVSLFLSYGLNFMAKLIYSAFDPGYWPEE